MARTVSSKLVRLRSACSTGRNTLDIMLNGFLFVSITFSTTKDRNRKSSKIRQPSKPRRLKTTQNRCKMKVRSNKERSCYTLPSVAVLLLLRHKSLRIRPVQRPGPDVSVVSFPALSCSCWQWRKDQGKTKGGVWGGGAPLMLLQVLFFWRGGAGVQSSQTAFM